MESQGELPNGRKTTTSRAYQLTMDRMIDDIETRIPKLKGKVSADSMRDHYSHAYNPRRSEGFGASKIILVEGATEEYSLPIYAESLPEAAFDPRGISVVECGEKTSMDRLFRIYNELHIPCYLLFDYDKGNQDRNIVEKSKELLALAKQSSVEPTALFISDTVAFFPNKWETDLATEIPDVAALTSEAKQALGIHDDTGKPLIARYIARKITARNPPYVPPSLGAVIGKVVVMKWKESCLKASSGSKEGPDREEASVRISRK
jgi:putative ATP-dependent endonuclease of the OLD family